MTPGECSVCHAPFDATACVVAFGELYLHSACFSCCKCRKQLDPDSGSTIADESGMPLCSDCAYRCSACGEPILEEAIQTDDAIYHNSCFRCSLCTERIDNLTFVKSGMVRLLS